MASAVILANTVTRRLGFAVPTSAALRVVEQISSVKIQLMVYVGNVHLVTKSVLRLLEPHPVVQLAQTVVGMASAVLPAHAAARR
jgi:hypothetical protein